MRSSAILLMAFALAACVARTPAPSLLGNMLTIGGTVIPFEDIQSAQLGFSPVGQPLVNVRLSPAGAVQFEALTRAFVGREMPIQVGGELLSNPRVMEPIVGGQVQISGLITVEAAKALASKIMGKRR